MASEVPLTIAEPSADQQQKDMYNSRRMVRGRRGPIDLDQKWAVCLLKLHPAVKQPGDYAALRTAIEAVAGIAEISLLVDGQAPSSIAADHRVQVATEVQMRIEDTS